MKVMVLDHQGKSQALASALTARGCELVGDALSADAVLIDHDVPFHGRIQYAETCVATGGRAFIYPHGAGAGLMAMWDGLYPVSPAISGVLVPAEGQVEVARRMGHPRPVHAIGWTLCPLHPRRRSGTRKILFAPVHPNGNGELATAERENNREIFARLARTPAQLVVRHIGPLEANGLPRVDDVEYRPGDIADFDGMIAEIDAADVVVGDRGTFSSIAVARGATTVIWDSDVIESDEDDARRADHVDLYRDYIRYPFDAADGDLWDVIRAAAADEDLVGEWRERFVGGPLDGDRLLEILHGDGAHLDPVHRAERLHRIALERVGADDHVTADRLLSEAVRRTADLPLLNDLAVVRFRQGRREEAEALLCACLVLDPGYAEARANLAAITQRAA